MSFPKSLIILLILSAVISPIFTFNVDALSGDEAFSAIDQANMVLVSAYDAVLEAEQTGGNLSSLISKLSEAGIFLSHASMLYRLGDFDEAIRFAGLSENLAAEVHDEVQPAKESALNERIQKANSTMIGSGVGAISVVLGSFFVWRFLKKRYP